MSALTTFARLKTERLLLRPPAYEDALSIARLANDAHIARMTMTLPSPYSLDDARAFLDHAQRLDPDRDRVFALMEMEAGLVGVMGLHRRDGPLPELGYWLGRPFWGRGLATEAGRAVMDWAVRDWGVRAVEAEHFVDNPASAHVLEKLGFLYTGVVMRRRPLGRSNSVIGRRMVWLA